MTGSRLPDWNLLDFEKKNCSVTKFRFRSNSSICGFAIKKKKKVFVAIVVVAVVDVVVVVIVVVVVVDVVVDVVVVEKLDDDDDLIYCCSLFWSKVIFQVDPSKKTSDVEKSSTGQFREFVDFDTVTDVGVGVGVGSDFIVIVFRLLVREEIGQSRPLSCNFQIFKFFVIHGI